VSSVHRNIGNEAASERVRSALSAQFARARQLCVAGQFPAAEEQCRRLLKTAPGHPQVILMLGEILSAQGRHQDAITTLQPVVEKWPNAGSAHFCLGNALHSAGRYAEAAEHLRRTTELQPHFAGGHCNLGLALEKLEQRDGAIHAYERALLLQPNLAEARANLGTALLNADKPNDAVFHLRQAAGLNPTLADNHFFLGTALQKCGADVEAAEAFKAAIARKPDFVEAYYSLAGVLTNQEKVAEALPCYQRAVALDPRFAAGWVGLGSALRSLGRFPEAIEAYEKALAINPDLGGARRALTTVRQEIADTAELDRLRRIMDNPEGGFEDRGAAGIAIAKIFDDCGRHDEAFAAATEANRLVRAGQEAADISYDHGAFRAQNDVVMGIFTPNFFTATQGWGNASELPVFIVGYFRTGTTLVEQICASHSQAYGAGELRDIPQISAHIQRIAPQPQNWTPQLFGALGDQHVSRLTALAPGKLRVVDKMPDNIYMLGLIATMLPRARVIFCHRDGRDAALSVFFQRFARQVAFATDLLDAGRRWHEAERMAVYWGGCLPLRAHHVRYETLIGDFESEARKLIAFLGLEWEPACLEFYKTERAVRTASTWQVRQPLYDSSVGRWRHYAKHLAPLCAAIGIAPDAETGTPPADLASPSRGTAVLLKTN
jgi:tetratricopeptide (TPR) repeat protein